MPGDHADDILDGTMCQGCGSLMEDLIPEHGNVLKAPPGHPRLCESCQDEEGDTRDGPPRRRRTSPTTKTINCDMPSCRKMFKNKWALKQHLRDRHGIDT